MKSGDEISRLLKTARTKTVHREEIDGGKLALAFDTPTDVIISESSLEDVRVTSRNAAIHLINTGLLHARFDGLGAHIETSAWRRVRASMCGFDSFAMPTRIENGRLMLCSFKRVNFTGSVDETTFQNCYFYGCNFAAARFNAVRFVSCEFHECQFHDTRFANNCEIADEGLLYALQRSANRGLKNDVQSLHGIVRLPQLNWADGRTVISIIDGRAQMLRDLNASFDSTAHTTGQAVCDIINSGKFWGGGQE